MENTSKPVHITANQILKETVRTRRGDSGEQFPTEWSRGDGSTLGSKTGKAPLTRKAMEAFVADSALEVDPKRDTAAAREGLQGAAGASEHTQGDRAKTKKLETPGTENYIG